MISYVRWFSEQAVMYLKIQSIYLHVIVVKQVLQVPHNVLLWWCVVIVTHCAISTHKSSAALVDICNVCVYQFFGTELGCKVKRIIFIPGMAMPLRICCLRASGLISSLNLRSRGMPVKFD